MSITIAKWTIEQYHKLVNAGMLSDRRVELLSGDIIEMSPESRLATGNISPLSFPDLEIEVRRLFS